MTLSIAVAGITAGAVSAVPYVIQGRARGWDVTFLPAFNALWIAVRIGLLTTAEEVGRAHGGLVRAFGAIALLFFLSPYLENWAMHWAGALIGGGTLEDPLAGLTYALDRATPPSLSSSVGWEQARMTAPFLALALARTRLGPLGCVLVCVTIGLLAFVPTLSLAKPRFGLGVTMFLLPAPTAVLALELVGAIERRIGNAPGRRGGIEASAL